MGAGKYTCKPKYNCIYTAYAEGFLTGDGVLAKVWDALEYLNQETEGAFLRIRQKIDKEFHKRASKLDAGSKQESGHMAQILGKTVDNPRKLRGGRYERIFFEEFGSDPIGITKWNQAEALVKILGTKIGTRFAWGTGGDSGPYLAALEAMFLNPEAFGGLPYKHNHTRDGDYVYTGYFVPADACHINSMDERGVTDSVKARAYYDKERESKAADPRNLQEFASEYCYYPEEALSRQGQNDFNQVSLAEQHNRISILKEVAPAKTYNLFWKRDLIGNIIGVDARESATGECWIAEMPQHDEQNKIIKNLYVAGIDGIDQGVDDSTVGEAGSKFAIVIKKRTLGTQGNKYVAGFKDRPNDVRKAYERALKLQVLFACKANMEDSKLGYRMYLRDKKMDHLYLMNRPSFALKVGAKRSKTLWGTPATPKMIQHGLELTRDFIEDFWESLNVLEIIEEMQKYSFANKTKFDYIAAIGMAEIGDEDMFALKVEESKPNYYADWQDVGYYIDDKGRRRFGLIPNSKQSNINYGQINASGQALRHG